MEDKPTGKGKNLTKQTEIYLQTVGWKQNIKELKQLKNHPDGSLNFFDWKLDFPEVMNQQLVENVGFDIVIANPPYDVYQGKKKSEIEGLLKFEIYHKCKGGKINAYELFLAKTDFLLKVNGTNCQIFQNSYLADNSSKGVRDYYFKNQHILFIDSFPERDDPKKRLFESVKMSVCILMSKKRLLKDYSFILKVHANRTLKNYYYVEFNKKEIYDFDPINAVIPNLKKEDKNIFLKYYKSTSNFCYSELFECIEGELNMTFHKSYMTNNIQNPLIVKGAQIQRYFITNKPSQGIIEFVDKASFIKDYPNSKKTYHHRSQRIALQGISGANDKIRIISTLINEDIYCANSCNYIISKEDNQTISIIAMLGVFNSKLTNWIFRKTSTNSNVNCYEINNLRLPIILKKNSKNVEDIVHNILTLKSQGKDTTALEQQIDNMVYKLYELTYEEVKIIDPENTLTEKEYADIKI
jgi:Alw26I/Eco31I/Esp3I family type II restriction m6 adenine DNA methyltransferase